MTPTIKNKYFIKIHLTTAFIVLCFFLSIPPLVSYIYSVYIFKPQQEKKNRALDNVQTRILDDLKYLSKNPLFEKPQYKKNAYFILKDKVAWSGTYVRHHSLFVEHYLRFQEVSHFKNFNPLSAQKVDFEIFLKAYKLQMGTLDNLSWMSELYSADHWIYVDQKIYSDILWNVTQKSTIERLAIANTLPVPNYNHLRDYAVLYFLKMREENNPEEGLRLIRHVSKLMQSSGTLMGQMTSVQMFKIEKHLANLYSISEWQGVEESRIEAFRRVSLAWPGVFNLAYSKEKFDAFRPYMDPENGVCTSVHEMPMSLLGLSEFLEPQWPFELQLMPLYEDKIFTLLQLQAECSAEAYSVFLEPVPDGEFFVDKEALNVTGRAPASSDYGVRVLNRAKIPYIRQMYGMMLTDVVSTNSFKLYDEKK